MPFLKNRSGTCEECFNREFAFGPPSLITWGDDEDVFSAADLHDRIQGWRMESNEDVFKSFKWVLATSFIWFLLMASALGLVPMTRPMCPAWLDHNLPPQNLQERDAL